MLAITNDVLYNTCMPKYAALLRGIAPTNPNMRNEKLRSLFEELGFSSVKTVISSGNVLFESSEADEAKIEALIEDALPKKLGFTSTTIVRSLDDLKKLAGAKPFSGYEHGLKTSLNVTFLKHAQKNQEILEGRGFIVISTSRREICSVIDMTAAKTPNFMAKAEKAFGKQITTRTWKTVERIIKALDA
jgi:uncharacterized protein (DUF1697 family)